MIYSAYPTVYWAGIRVSPKMVFPSGTLSETLDVEKFRRSTSTDRRWVPTTQFDRRPSPVYHTDDRPLLRIYITTSVTHRVARVRLRQPRLLVLKSDSVRPRTNERTESSRRLRLGWVIRCGRGRTSWTAAEACPRSYLQPIHSHTHSVISPTNSQQSQFKHSQSGVHLATSLSRQFPPSSVFCCRPDGLELTARLSTWYITQRRHFGQSLKMYLFALY